MNDEDLFGEDTLDLMYLYDDPGDGMVGHWFDNLAFDYVENYPEEEKYVIKPGEGIWLDCPVAQYGEKIVIKFPTPLADHSAE